MRPASGPPRPIRTGQGPGGGAGIAVHVNRRRLVARVAAARLVAVEAASGAGKSSLLRDLAAGHDGAAVTVSLSAPSAGPAQFARRLRAALLAIGLSDLASEVDRAGGGEALVLLPALLEQQDGSLLLAIDDSHLADDELSAGLEELAATWPAPHRLAIAGRRLSAPLVAALATQGATNLTADDLAFQPDEARELLTDELLSRLDDGDVLALLERTEGWAAALSLTVTTLQHAAARGASAFDQAMRRSLATAATLTDLLDDLLQHVPPRERQAIGQLAALPWLEDELIGHVGIRGGSARLADLGLPLVPAGTGLWSLPDVVREALGQGDPDPELIDRAAERYAALDRPGEALELLRTAGSTTTLTRFLRDLPPASLLRLDVVDHAAAVTSLPPTALASSPRILVDLADLYILSGRLEEYRETLARAAAILDHAPREDLDEAQALEVRAAELTARAVAREDDRLVGDAEELLADPQLPPLARARLLGAVGRLTASRRTATALRTALSRLEEAATLFDREGATPHAIATRVIAASAAAWPLGRYDVALALLDRALGDGHGDPVVRVGALPYRAFILIELGRYAEAEAALAELRRTATATGQVGNERSAAFARWGMAKLASQRGDAEETWVACRAVERSEVAVDAGHGAGFRSDAAQLLARVGRFDEAQYYLAEARRRDPGTSPAVPLGDLAVGAYEGDLARVEAAVGELEEHHEVEPRERWRVTMLHAFACHRGGDDRAQVLAASAFEEAAQLGYPDLPRIREASLAEVLLPLAAQSSASARGSVQARSAARIQLFGRFALTLDGRTHEPTGRPGELVAYLAINGRQATADQVIEALWPGSTPSKGRERLRTVLRRTRRDLGDLIERHEDLLRLRDGVETDVDRVQQLIDRTRTPEGPRETAAREALQLMADELAPTLTYHPWLDDARRRFERQSLQLLDLVTAAAETDGRLDDAIRALLTAIAREPLAEDRYLTAARLVAEQGRRSRALSLIGQAREALDAEGLTPTAELDRLEAYLRRDPLVAVQAS